MNAATILEELGITEDVLAIFPYGSQVYGTADENSDHDFIIVLKRSLLENGAFRQNAISNPDKTIQAVLYSRGGFIDALNNYEIGALECLSLPPELVLLKKWPFKISKWHEKTMIKKIIQKASASRHIADQQAKTGYPDRAKKGIFHALRILHFGLQLKEHQKIVDFQACNDLFYQLKEVSLENFDTRDYYVLFDELLEKIRA